MLRASKEQVVGWAPTRQDLLYIDPHRPTKNHKLVEQLGKLVVITKFAHLSHEKHKKQPITFHEILVV